jgi:hypothetical protein
VAVIVAAIVVAVPRAREPREPHDFLRAAAGMSDANLAALDRGEAIARVLDTDRREVAVVGAVRIKGSRRQLIARYRDVSNLRRSKLVLELGTFSQPARPDDLLPLRIEPYDLDAVRECEPGDCPVRLSPPAMTRFHDTVDWKSADWRRAASGVWRDVLAGMMAAYQANGDRALPEHHNKQAALRVQDEFHAIYQESAYVARMAPDGFRYLREFPRQALHGAADIFYWSKDDFGVRPVTSLTHLVLYDPPDRRPALVATKQIYAAHYFDAALGLTLAIEDGAGGFYMVSMNRARTRSLTSRFRGIVRGIVQGRSREALEGILASTKQSIEADASAGRQ